MKQTIIIALFLFSEQLHAFDNFKCTIKDAVNLEDDGTLNHESHLVEWYLGKEFVVNRDSGLITGAMISNTMSGQIPLVYDHLPEENGYRAITHYKSINAIDYLQINQYLKNSEKPFFFKGAFGTMISGICVKY